MVMTRLMVMAKVPGRSGSCLCRNIFCTATEFNSPLVDEVNVKVDLSAHAAWPAVQPVICSSVWPTPLASQFSE